MVYALRVDFNYYYFIFLLRKQRTYGDPLERPKDTLKDKTKRYHNLVKTQKQSIPKPQFKQNILYSECFFTCIRMIV